MKIKNNKGLTLMELIIAIALVTIVLGIGYRVFDKVQTLPSKQASNSDIQNGMNRVRDLITKELKYCESVELEYKDGNKTIAESIVPKGDISQEDINNKKEFILAKIKEDDTFEYKFNVVKSYSEDNKLDNDTEQTSYVIETNTELNNKYFSVSKIDHLGVKLKLIIKQKLDDSKLPMNITYKDGIYSTEISYLDNSNKGYEFEVYNNVSSNSDNDTVEPPDVLPPDNNGVKNLIKECIIQSSMLIQQIEFEARGGSFQKEIDECKEIAKDIIDNYDYYWQNKDELREEIDDLKEELSELSDKVGHGNSQHKIDIRDHLKNSNYYLEKALYILNNQDYSSTPELTRDLLLNLSINSLEDNKYVSFKGIINELKLITVNMMFEKLESYCNIDGEVLIGNTLEPKISTLEAQINTVSRDYLQPMYHPFVDTNQDKKKALNNAIDKLITEFEDFKEDDIDELSSTRSGRYVYLNKNINHQDESCALMLIDNLKQNINIVIEELKYMKFIIGE